MVYRDLSYCCGDYFLPEMALFVKFVERDCERIDAVEAIIKRREEANG